MKKVQVFSGKTIEEAKEKAVETFGIPEEKITFTIIEEGKKGFLGLGKTDAQIKAEYETAEETAPAPKAEPKKVSETVKAEPVKAEAPVQTETTETAEEEPVKEIPQEKLDICKAFLTKILKAMDIDCTVDVRVDNGGIFAEIDSKGSGTIIGRRGETLDSLQYLTSLVINRTEGDYIRITLDSCGYREKRTETLKKIAEKKNHKVLKSGRATTLEPMNPYERRVIHSTVAKVEGVKSKSVGEEPYRKVVISSENPRRNDRYRKGGGRGHGRPHREPRSLDLKTSFEKDYKKPKPEDDINAGLYGKIEI